jgi:hypothetical protein
MHSLAAAKPSAGSKRSAPSNHGSASTGRPAHTRNGSTVAVTFGVARVDLQRAIDLSDRKVVVLAIKLDLGQHVICARRGRIEGQRLQGERFRFPEFLRADWVHPDITA